MPELQQQARGGIKGAEEEEEGVGAGEQEGRTSAGAAGEREKGKVGKEKDGKLDCLSTDKTGRSRMRSPARGTFR